MNNLKNRIFGSLAVTVGLAIVLLLAAIKRIEENYDDQYFWE